jgi:predicted nucleotidyltransferase
MGIGKGKTDDLHCSKKILIKKAARRNIVEKHSMGQKVEKELAAIKDIIVNTVSVEQIYLFGSYAYGIPNKDSDLDIYVVMCDDVPYNSIEAKQRIFRGIHDIQTMSNDILVGKKSRFDSRKKLPTIEQEISEKGIVIYG